MSSGAGEQPSAARELQRLAEEVQRLRALIAHGDNPVWCFQLEPPAPVDLPEEELVERVLASRLVEASPASAQVFARESVDQILGLTMAEVSVAALDDLRQRVRDFIRRGFTLGEARFDSAASGGPRRVRHQVLGAVRDGRLEALWGTSSDRTEHAVRESELERERALLDAVMHTSVAAIVLMDPDGRIVAASAAAESILGLARDEILKRSYNDPEWRVSRADGEPMPDEELPFRRALASNGVVHGIRMGIDWPGGEHKLLSVDAAAMRDPSGRPTGVVASVVDITERERAEGALRDSEEWLRLAFEGARMGSWSWEAGSNRVRWSKRTAALFGRTPDQAPVDYDRYLELVWPEDRERVDATVRAALASEAGDYLIEHRLQWPDGSLHWIEARGQVYRDQLGNVRGMNGVVMDVDERRQLQEHIERTSRVESIGRLAGGVAHDFNNLLTAVLGYGELALSALRQQDPARESIERVLEAARRGAALTRQLLAFARRQPASPRVVELNELVEGVARLLPRLLGEDIDVVLQLGPDLPRVRADVAQIEQVLVNLAVNARDAMPRGGRFTIQTQPQHVTTADSSRHPDATPGDFVVLSVHDEGEGMAPEVAARAFEPFFTTKPVGQGTGLGLATSYGIARQHGGWIEVESDPASGTVFRLFLPATAESPVAEADAAVDSSPSGRGELLLVVEDDAAIRELLSGSLPALGYDVLLAGDGEQALEVARAHSRPVDLLVTDLVMPRMGGRELATRLRGEQPGLRVLYASGYDAEGQLRGVHLARGEGFLPKPYTPALLAQRVRDLLAVS